MTPLAMKPPLLRSIEAMYAVMQRDDFLTMTEEQMLGYMMQASHGALSPAYAAPLAKEMRKDRDRWVASAP